MADFPLFDFQSQGRLELWFSDIPSQVGYIWRKTPGTSAQPIQVVYIVF